MICRKGWTETLRISTCAAAVDGSMVASFRIFGRVRASGSIGGDCFAGLRYGGSRGPFEPAAGLGAQSATAGALRPDALRRGHQAHHRPRAGHASTARAGHAVTINGTVPGPLLRLKEGQHVRIAVTNTLDEDTSIHWHGLLVPFQMDGVPGVSFPASARRDLRLRVPVIQSGTYWYHSHSGLQEQEGHYAPDRHRAGRAPIRSPTTAST